MQIAVRHELTFGLGVPARAVAHLLLTPLPSPQQRIVRWSIVMPGIAEAAQFRDGFGNRAHLVSLQKPEDPIVIVVEGAVETSDKAGVVGRLDRDPAPAMFLRQSGKADAELIAGLEQQGGRIAMLHELMERVHGRAGQSQSQDGQSQSQQGAITPQAMVESFIAAARALEVPARYVTGYADETEGQHVWAEAWDDGLGWIGFDPLLNVCPADGHVRLASALDATSAAPVRIVPGWTEAPQIVVAVEAA